MPVRVQSKNEQTYRKLKAYLMYPEQLQQISSQLFKVLDITKTGYFKRDDLVMFIGFVVKELELQGIGELEEEQIDDLLKKANATDTKRINQDQLSEFMILYFNKQKDTYESSFQN